MFQRRPLRGRKPPSSPVSALMEDEFHAKEWPGNRGEFLVAGPHVPQPPPQIQVGFPPPDWEQELRERGEQTDPGPQQTAGTAIEAMMAGAVELGEIDEPRAFALPLQLAPLQRFQGAEVDWHEVEAAAVAENKRAERVRAAQLLAEPEPLRIPKPPWATGDGAA